MAEYLADTAGQGVVKAVYVQANWAPERAEAEDACPKAGVLVRTSISASTSKRAQLT